jgi:hypothetical protein
MRPPEFADLRSVDGFEWTGQRRGRQAQGFFTFCALVVLLLELSEKDPDSGCDRDHLVVDVSNYATITRRCHALDEVDNE